MSIKRIFSVTLIICLLITSFSFMSFAAETGIINGADGSLNVRDLPGGSSSKVIDTLANGTKVNVLSTVGSWYYISYTVSDGSLNYGYVYSAYVIVGSSSSDSYISDTVPSVYSSYITSLKAQHPNWQFRFYYTGLDWNDVVAYQTKAGVNSIAGVPLSYKSTSSNFNITGESYIEGYVLSDFVRRDGGSYLVSTSGSTLTMRSGAGTGYGSVASIPNGTAIIVSDCIKTNDGKFWYKAKYYNSYGTYYYKTVEGSSWFQPHGQVVRYYLDPRNFLDETNIFQFEQLAFDSSVHNEQGVIAIIKNTFMNNTLIQTTDGRSITYAKAIMEAASTYNVSPYHLASRIIQEVGPNGSVASRGNSSSYPGIYNFYNIGAYTGVTDGLKWASQGTTYWRPWNTQYKSIMGGAQYIASGYISRGQSTLYFQKFDVVSNGGKYYDHQYMSNVVAPSAEGVNVCKAYKSMGIADSNFVFLIPVYNNMPGFAYPLPAKYNYPNMLPDSDPGYLQQFTDVNIGDWYFDAVKFVSDNGYMMGYGNGRFGVNDTIKREDFSIVLARIAGANAPEYCNSVSSFPDVNASSYYNYAVCWANDKGIIGGYENGNFGVGDNITREQVCTIIYRYAQSIFVDTALKNSADKTLSAFSDSDKVSDFALDALAWCVEKGLITGTKEGMVKPQSFTTRAEMAVIVKRMTEAGLYYPGYPDVETGTWYYDAVQLAYHKGLIKGYSNGKFGPADGIQRQDFVVIMSRLGSDLSDYETQTDTIKTFPDVTGGSYYYDAVNWAVSLGVINGYSNGKFGVGDKITRQDACTIIYRYLSLLNDGDELTDEEVKELLSPYNDADKIYDYASQAMAWCIKNGVISGKNSTTLAPTANISRAEIAQVFKNIIDNSLI